MTLPMKKRFVFDAEMEHDLEANAIFSLANKLSPLVSLASATPDGIDAAGAFVDLPSDGCPAFPDVSGALLDRDDLRDLAALPPAPHYARDRAGDLRDVATLPPACPRAPDRPVGDLLLGATVTPPPTPPLRTADDRGSSRPARAPLRKARQGRTSSLPTSSDPMDESFSMSLYAPGEEGIVNPTHIAIRKDVLRVRATESGRVYFQCACCESLPRDERARYSTIAPQSLKNLYQGFVRFMMYHVAACERIPDEIRALASPSAAKDVRVGGIKKFWPASAYEKGLRDDEDGRGIVYCKPVGETAAP